VRCFGALLKFDGTMIGNYLSRRRELCAIKARSLNPQPVDVPVGVILDVCQSDRYGNPTGPHRKKHNDLVLDNLGAFLAALFAAYTGATRYVCGNMVDTSGTSRTVCPYTTTWGALFNRYDKALGCLVGVGAGTTTEQRSDYNLETQVGSWTPLSGDAAWTSAAGTVTFAGSVLIAGGATITEAGLIAYMEQSNQTGPYPFMLLHDMFDGVPIIAGKYAHLAYTIQL
jgi:hypothetical protein